MSDIPPPAPSPAAGAEDKTVAILAYITLVGFIIALVMHNGKKTALGSFHLRQVLGIVVTGFAVGFVGWIPIIGWLILLCSLPVLFVIWIMGLIAAVNGQQKAAPILGQKYQQWFAGAFA